MVLLAGCTIIEPEASASLATSPSSWSAGDPEARTGGSAATTEGPCHELNEGRVQFVTDDAVRVLFAVAHERDDTEVVLTSCLSTNGSYVEEWATAGYVGSGGFGPEDATEVNTLQTPTGSYTMTEGFGRSDPGTELEYHTLTPESRWGGREDSNHFNQYFEGPGEWPDEDLWRLMQSGLYEQAVVINFNRPPDAVAQPGRSFAIFLHAGLTESWGCVSTDLDTVTRVLQNATPGDRIVMGAEDDVFGDPDTP
ncbi:L,D-transpeptidase family protein [Microbacterium sp. A93]|uniref:L,D-transpeptidase family protein n=1 Tax=Microbacterium sp. A93 TaxID=3450716 RepID=UPI003F432D80